MISRVRPSRLRRTSGSVLLMRTFAHQPSESHASTDTPSRSNTFAFASYAARIRARTSAGGVVVFVLISPYWLYLRSGAISSESGLSPAETMLASAYVAIDDDSAVKFALK